MADEWARPTAQIDAASAKDQASQGALADLAARLTDESMRLSRVRDEHFTVEESAALHEA